MTESKVNPGANIDRGVARADIFAELYEQHMPRVYRYVYYKVNNTQLAEDLTSTVFEKALTRFHSFRSEKASFITWLFAIARNTMIDHFRSKSSRENVPLEDVYLSSDNSPEDKAIEQDEARRLRACISTLPKREQEIISLKFGAGMTNRDISAMLGLSESNVGTIIFRTVRTLRDRFMERENG